MASEFLSRYTVDQIIQVFKNDQEFYQVITNEHNITISNEQYKSLTETLLTEREYIAEHTIEELNAENPPFLREEIATIYGKTFIEEAVYRQTLYTFKYSTIKTFFRDNYNKFLPDYDFVNIESKEKLKIFQEAFMREYDRLANIIDEIYNIVDINKVPTEYLNYLAQAIGYEREDSKLLTDASFRELIKNIIEVYRIKGTNYSFELFFNFLGYEAILKEYWFDKRYSDPNINSNPETGQTDKQYASFYMSSIKPTQYIPEGMRNPYIVTEDLIIETQDVNDFTRMTIGNEYTYEQLIGDKQGYPDQPYTFFKTNVIQYSLSKIITGETEEELSEEDLETIQKYADFLTPLFIQKNIVILIKPFEDSGESFIFKDENKHDPRSPNPDDYLDESMFHLYQGKQPTKYYWDDGNRYYGEDNIPRPDGSRRYDYPVYEYWKNDGYAGGADTLYNKRLDVEPGGHFISGYYKDTYEKIYDRTVGCGSAYDQIASANPTWDSEDILIYISGLLSLGRFFSTPEKTEIICSADIGGSLNSKYFYINGPHKEYYVWYDVDGTGIDPAVADRTGIKINITSGATANEVATATAAEIDEKKIYYMPVSISDRAGNLTNGSPIVSINTTTSDLEVGMEVTASGGLPSGCVIVFINSISQITLNKNATATGPVLLSFAGTKIEITDDFHATADTNKVNVVTTLQKDAANATDVDTGFTINVILEGADFSPYGRIAERDLIPPMTDGVFIPANQSFVFRSDFYPGTPITMGAGFSPVKGDKKRLSEAVNTNGINNTAKAKIVSIDTDNGTGKAVIVIKDLMRRFQYLSSNDFITLFSLIDETNEGNYRVESVSRNGNNTEITLTTVLPGADQTREGGFIQLYFEEWIMENFRFPFLFDRVLEFDPINYILPDSEEALGWFIDHPDEHLLKIEADKEIGEPNPFNIPGQNYTNFPEGRASALTPELLWPYSELKVSMEADYETEVNSSQMYQLWTFYKIAEQELKVAGLYEEGLGTLSTYKFMDERNYYFSDYLYVEKA